MAIEKIEGFSSLERSRKIDTTTLLKRPTTTVKRNRWFSVACDFYFPIFVFSKIEKTRSPSRDCVWQLTVVGKLEKNRAKKNIRFQDNL